MPDAPTAAPAALSVEALEPAEGWCIVALTARRPNIRAVYETWHEAVARRLSLTHPERYRVVQVEIRAREG